MKHSRVSIHAFTMLEAVVSITVVAIIAATVLPLVTGAGDAYATASTTRKTAENTAYAMDRIVAMLRDTPAGASTGTVGITTAQAANVVFTDGRALSLSGTDLMLTASGTSTVLLRNVTSFALSYLDQTGQISTAASPTTTWNYRITLVSGGFELRSQACIRIKGGGS